MSCFRQRSKGGVNDGDSRSWKWRTFRVTTVRPDVIGKPSMIEWLCGPTMSS